MILWADDKIRNTALLLCITLKKANLDRILFQANLDRIPFHAKNKPVIPDHPQQVFSKDCKQFGHWLQYCK